MEVVEQTLQSSVCYFEEFYIAVGSELSVQRAADAAPLSHFT